MRAFVLALLTAPFVVAPPLAAAPQASPAGLQVESPPIDGVETFANLSPEHVAGVVDYEQSPPVGGPHNPVWQNCGFYDAPVPNERAAHSEEHGAVWIAYRPDVPADQLEPLRRLADRNDFVLVSPYSGLSDPIVVSAWGAQLRLDDAADPRLRQFVRFYAGNGPERGAPCDNGSDETMSPDAVASPAAESVATPLP